MITDTVNAANAHFRKTREGWIMLHLNPSTQTPPVNCPLLIQLPNGKLVQAERQQWATSHSAPLEFHGEGVGYWVGMNGRILEEHKMAKPKRKRNPMKLAKLVSDYACIVHSGEGRDMVLLDLRSMAPFRPTAHQATVLLNYEHPWSVYTSVEITVGGKVSVKTDYHDLKQRYRHSALVDYLTEYHAEQMRRERADHISGFAWICCPSGRNFSDGEIKRLYEVAERYSAKVED